MKKKFSIFLILALLINLLTPLNFLADDEKANPYDDKTNTFKFTTDTPIVSSGIAYRTVGFKAHFNSNGKDYKAYFTMKHYMTSPEYTKFNRQWQINYFRVPLSYDNGYPQDNTVPIYESFDRSYTDPVDRENIAAFFANDNIIYLDGVFAKVYNGVEQGTFTVGTDGKPTPQGTIWMTKDEILGSGIDWTKSTQSAIETYYNIPLGYVAQPVGDLKPVISRLDENNRSVVEPNGIYTFKEGEPINLVGVESTFPNKTVPLGFKWRYKKQGASTFTAIDTVSTPSSVIPSTLEVGTYTVELETTATYERPWDSTPVTKSSRQNKDPNIPKVATATLVIEKNLEPLATAVMSPPSEIMLAATQNTINIPVTLNTAVLNVEPTDILSVELQMSTLEKDQTRSQFFFPSLNQSMSHSFTIAYNGMPKTQIFEGKAIVTLKGGGIIESPIARTMTYLYKANNNLPPVPIINAPSETLVGSVYISGAQSYDIDGKIVKYDFRIPSIGFYQEDTKSFCFPNFNRTGTFQVILGVTDDDGARSETGTFIKVTPVQPSIELSTVGFYKENRKITIRAMNWTESMSAVGDNYNWTIKPMDVTASQSNVKMVSTYGKQIEVLMKVKGKYLVTCKGTNSYGISDTKTMILNVVEDQSPIMVIDSTTPKFRDGTRIAVVKAYDHSYSTDGDFIKRRVWSYRFDSDNDGLFTDESSVTLKTTEDYADNQVEFNVGSVGKYEISLAVTEAFGQETISQFITQADYRTGAIKQVITVDNYKPSVSFMAVNEKKIDIDVMTDYEGQDLLDLETKLNTMVNEGYEDFLNVNFNIISGKKYIGRYMNPEAENYFCVLDSELSKYEVAEWSGGLIEFSDNSYHVEQSTTRLYSNKTEVTDSFFDSRIKSAYKFNYDNAKMYWLENGDVYFLGTNSKNDAGAYGSGSIWVMKPYKIASNIKQIEGGDNKYLLLSTSGDVYWFGSTILAAEQQQFGPYFTAVHNTVDFGGVLPYTQDPYGLNPYASSTYDNFSGLKNTQKLTAISDVDYMWSNGVSTVFRKSNGDWYGFGSGLNAFGLDTGYENVPRQTLNGYDGYDYYKDTDKPYTTSWYFDNVNTITYIPNLTDLDKTLNGIAKVEPNIVYAKNGDKYSIKQTPFTLHGSEFFADETTIPQDGRTYTTLYRYITSYNPLTYGVTVYYGFQNILSKGTFSYSKIGTWEEKPNSRKLWLNRSSESDINLYGESVTPYYLSKIPEPDTVEIRSTYQSLPFTQVYSIWLQDPTSLINDYQTLSYTVNYTYSSKVPTDWYDEDDHYYGYKYYFKGTIGDKVLIKKNTFVNGWKSYGVDASKITTSTHRAGAAKYLLYLAKNDSFKKVSKDIENYIKDEDISVRVSTKASYVDDYAINPDLETNLRNLMNANTKGKQYGEDAIEQMIADILAENKVKLAPDGGTYVILGEDTISYDKFYRDLENDPKLSESSKVIHEKDYYKNSMGLSAYHNQTLSVPLTTFDKVGKYEIEYRATDKPSTNYRFAQYNRTSDPATLKVYVHRRPIADFDINYNYQTSSIGINMKNQSYDPDHQGEWGNGIVKSTWAYRKKGDINWTSGTPSTLNYKDAIEIALTVTDLEGATSSKVKSYTM
ncbi:hypothetical protein, partial [Fusibacter ferrireducens]